jgi:release factor glutamine methyltransferase
MVPSVRNLLSDAQARIASALDMPVQEARIEAQILMCVALGNLSRAQLILSDSQTPSPVQAEQFFAILERRLAGEPVAYILGKREFYGLEFKVSADVLIPRADTETLVETALALIPPQQPCRVLDLGTGSGAIAIAIAHQRPQASITAVDASPAALGIAAENAQHLTTGNIRLLHSHWFSAVENESFEVIVSNPPYIAAQDPHLKQGDLRFEPPGALASGRDGLDDIRHIVQEAPRHLAANGWLMLEHGYDQAGAVRQLLIAAGFKEVHSQQDIAGIERVTLGLAN